VAVLAEGFGDDSLAEHDKCRKSGQNDQCGADQVPGISKDLTHRQGCQQYNDQTVFYSKIARFLVVNFNRGGFGGAGELGEITQGGGKTGVFRSGREQPRDQPCEFVTNLHGLAIQSFGRVRDEDRPVAL
jgi:hypothetical protein